MGVENTLEQTEKNEIIIRKAKQGKLQRTFQFCMFSLAEERSSNLILEDIISYLFAHRNIWHDAVAIYWSQHDATQFCFC